MGAAAIYEQRWAPEVWLTLPSDPAEEAALAQLAIRVFREDFYNRQVLERPVLNTVEELEAAAYTADGWWRRTRDALGS